MLALDMIALALEVSVYMSIEDISKAATCLTVAFYCIITLHRPLTVLSNSMYACTHRLLRYREQQQDLHELDA